MALTQTQSAFRLRFYILMLYFALFTVAAWAGKVYGPIGYAGFALAISIVAVILRVYRSPTMTYVMLGCTGSFAIGMLVLAMEVFTDSNVCQNTGYLMIMIAVLPLALGIMFTIPYLKSIRTNPLLFWQKMLIAFMVGTGLLILGGVMLVDAFPCL